MIENARILIHISLHFVPLGPINNIPALVQIMAWRRPGDKTLSEPMMVRLPTHICVTRPQWVKHPSGHFADDILECIFLNEKLLYSDEISIKIIPKGLIKDKPSLVKIMACCWTGKPMKACFFFTLYMHQLASMNYMNPRYFTLAAIDLKPQQMPMFLHISARVWGHRWSPHTSEQKGCMFKPQ